MTIIINDCADSNAPIHTEGKFTTGNLPTCMVLRSGKKTGEPTGYTVCAYCKSLQTATEAQD